MKIRLVLFPVRQSHRKPYRRPHLIILPNLLYSTAMVDGIRVISVESRNAIRIVKKVNEPCRAWKARNCKWGDKCSFQHEILVCLVGASCLPNRPLVT